MVELNDKQLSDELTELKRELADARERSQDLSKRLTQVELERDELRAELEKLATEQDVATPAPETEAGDVGEPPDTGTPPSFAAEEPPADEESLDSSASVNRIAEDDLGPLTAEAERLKAQQAARESQIQETAARLASEPAEDFQDTPEAETAEADTASIDEEIASIGEETTVAAIDELAEPANSSTTPRTVVDQAPDFEPSAIDESQSGREESSPAALVAGDDQTPEPELSALTPPPSAPSTSGVEADSSADDGVPSTRSLQPAADQGTVEALNTPPGRTLTPAEIREALRVGIAAYQDGDFQRAGEIWRRLAELGVPRAQFHYGALLAEGHLGPIDLDEARRWLSTAADAGDPRAARLLSQLGLS
ncbi:MAG: hypothetical protein ACFB6S_08655 [Geminicoccaceae bacterium]